MPTLLCMQSVGAGHGAKPTAAAAAALRTVFASLSQQAARGVAAALANVPDHVRDTLWRDFAAAGNSRTPSFISRPHMRPGGSIAEDIHAHHATMHTGQKN